MQFLAQYGLFLAKVLTAVIAILVVVGGIIVILRKDKGGDKNKLEIKKLNDKYQETQDLLEAEILSKKEYKKLVKARKKQDKTKIEEAKKRIFALQFQGDIKASAVCALREEVTAILGVATPTEEAKKRIFVLQFQGDIKASAVCALREEVTAILGVATPTDEVVVCLESAGGLVSAYGLAASQLQRFKNKKIPLTIIIDKIAASGGYLMACVADRILAAPFAVIGSIGVVAQLPNFYRYLKKKDIDFELLTAGQYKRTLTVFGENTPEGREKFQQEIEEIHTLFKNYIAHFRPNLDLQKIATGEHWLAAQAIDLKLVDELSTSDDYLLTASQQADIYQLTYTGKKSLLEKLGAMMSKTITDWHAKI